MNYENYEYITDFQLYFLNKDILVIPHDFEVNFSVHINEFPLERRMSQNFYLGLRFDFIIYKNNG